jgi:hypothetical protein
MTVGRDLTEDEVLGAVSRFHEMCPESPVEGDSRYQDRINAACKKLGIPLKEEK